MANRVNQKSRGGDASTIKGSIGEHLAVAHLLETFASDDVFSDIEVFHIDRGPDIGIDFVVRLHVKKEHRLKKNFSFSIGIQVKNYGKKSKQINKTEIKIESDKKEEYRDRLRYRGAEPIPAK